MKSLFACLLLTTIVPMCGACREQGEDIDQARHSPIVAEAVAASPTRVVSIEASDLSDVDSHELVFSDEETFSDGWIGKPKILLEAPHIELSRDAMSPTRGFVHLVDGPKWPNKAVESRLIDFESGDEILRVARVNNGQYRFAGVAFGEAIVDGVSQYVLIHVDNGQVVSWSTRVPEQNVNIVVAGPNDAWIFVNADGSPEHEKKTLYAHWTDMRKPPPRPERELPWYFTTADNLGEVEGPSRANQVRAPVVVKSRYGEGECAKAEMMPDGTHECRPEDFRALAQGWRLWNHGPNGTGEAFNVDTGERQRLAFSEGCIFVEEPTLDPPRSLVRCADTKDEFLWSPTGVARIPDEAWNASFSRSSWDGRTMYAVDWEDVRKPTVQWLDVVRGEIISTAPVVDHLGYGNLGTTIVHRLDDASRLYVVDFESHTGSLLRNVRGCREYGHHQNGRSLHVYSCWHEGGPPRWTEVVDYASGKRYRLPPLQLRVWVEEASRTVVGVHDGAKDRVLAWTVPQG